MISELDELLGVTEGVESEEFIPRSETAGSLDYIDSLPTEPPILTASKADILSARDATVISNAFDVQDIPQALPHDNRRFNPSNIYDPGELSPGSSQLIHKEFRESDLFYPRQRRFWWNDPYHSRPLSQQSRFSARIGFREPGKLEICIKRRIRREIMHAMGLSGIYYPKRRYTPFDFIFC